MTSEPVAIVNAIATAVRVGLVALVAFGLDFTPEQIAASVAAVEGLAWAVATIVTRGRVRPVPVEERDYSLRR